LLQSCLGLEFDPVGRQITFNQAILPEFLNDMVLRRLSVGGRSVDVALSRAGSRVVVNVLSDDKELSVVSRT
jgi:hypothetical protein